jgi:cell division protease FtsH
VLALAHALETHKTLSGEDVRAVFEHGRGPLVDGTPYAEDEFIGRLREYHLAAARAHREHSPEQLSLPAAVPAYAAGVAVAGGYGTPSGSGVMEIPFGGSSGDSGDVISNGPS